jgi:hypothetical protein
MLKTFFALLHFYSLMFGINTKVMSNIIYRIFMEVYYDHTLVINILTTMSQ